MSGFENFWNFKTMLDKQDSTLDEDGLESGHVLQSNVPIFTAVQLSVSNLYHVGEEDASDKAGDTIARDEKFVAELQKLEQLSIPKLHELRRKIALHSHPDLQFKTGVSDKNDLMSQANSLIDDEIKRRLSNDP